MKAQTKRYKAALYMRLSKEDDDPSTESASIQTQRKILRTFAQENGFGIYNEYIDDGWSGTNFNRPGFKRMVDDIERQNVNMVITKDLSRLGRDYITAGQYTELYFPEHQVRYIAINDGYDSINPYNDIAPFQHVMNELYARDTSKKIRSAFAAKMEEGSFIGNFAPYGYQKDGENKNHLVVDEEAAPIVKQLFTMAQNGAGPSEIARALNARGVLTPAMYRRKHHPAWNANAASQRKEWTSAMICKMLKNTVYLGHMAQGKTSKLSFKSKIIVTKPKEDWHIVEHTHEALVSQQMFDSVRKRCVSRKSQPTGAFQNIFSGIATCMDCGRNMSSTKTRKSGATANLVCGRYKLSGSAACSNHFIDYQTLYAAVLRELKKQLYLPRQEQQELLLSLVQEKPEPHPSCHAKNVLMALENRAQEINRIIQHLYEDNVNGTISNERFANLLCTYEAEQKSLVEEISRLSAAPVPEREQEAREKRLSLIEDAFEITELTPAILRHFIEHIEIGQGYFENGNRKGQKFQTIRVFYRFTEPDNQPALQQGNEV